ASERLGETLNDDGLPQLLEPCRDDDWKVRCAALKVLEQFATELSVDLITSALHDTSEEVRAAAAAALGRLRSTRAIGYLSRTLHDERPAVRSAAALALRALGWRPDSSEDQALLDIASGQAQAAVFAGEGAVTAL